MIYKYIIFSCQTERANLTQHYVRWCKMCSTLLHVWIDQLPRYNNCTRPLEMFQIRDWKVKHLKLHPAWADIMANLVKLTLNQVWSILPAMELLPLPLNQFRGSSSHTGNMYQIRYYRKGDCEIKVNTCFVSSSCLILINSWIDL